MPVFLKELEAVLIPWWFLALLVTGAEGVWRWPILIMALYCVLTEIRYRVAVRESRAAGFKRVVRMPVSPWLLRLILWRRVKIPHGRCYTLHVHGKMADHKTFIRELKQDMANGTQASAVYIGNTLYALGAFARRQLGDPVQTIDGTLFGRWLQTWRIGEHHWQIVRIDSCQKSSHACPLR